MGGGPIYGEDHRETIGETYGWTTCSIVAGLLLRRGTSWGLLLQFAKAANAHGGQKVAIHQGWNWTSCSGFGLMGLLRRMMPVTSMTTSKSAHVFGQRPACQPPHSPDAKTQRPQTDSDKIFDHGPAAQTNDLKRFPVSIFHYTL